MSHRFGLLFSTLLCSALAVPAAAQRFLTVDPISGHTYEVSQTVEFWDVAQTQASTFSVTDTKGNTYQGYFSAISSASENAFILDSFRSLASTVWIGLTDTNSPTNFYWADGEPLVYTNWSVGEPNSGGTEHYVQMFGTNGTWNDFTNTQLNYIIEYNTPPANVPEPGTIALTASLLTFGTAFALRRRKRSR